MASKGLTVSSVHAARCGTSPRKPRGCRDSLTWRAGDTAASRSHRRTTAPRSRLPHLCSATPEGGEQSPGLCAAFTELLQPGEAPEEGERLINPATTSGAFYFYLHTRARRDAVSNAPRITSALGALGALTPPCRKGTGHFEFSQTEILKFLSPSDSPAIPASAVARSSGCR